MKNLKLARISLFLVYFWFGFIKLLGLSPANPLVESLLARTLPFISFTNFILILGIAECVIGVLWLKSKATNLAFKLTMLHLVTTFAPLFLLPQVAWQSFMVPTIEGQYIIKNVLIFALSVILLESSKLKK